MTWRASFAGPYHRGPGEKFDQATDFSRSGRLLTRPKKVLEAGAHTRPLFSST